MNLYGLSFILDGVVKMILCCLGVVGNSISIILLLSVRMRNSFNKLLAILAVFDLVYLVTMMMDSLRDLGFHSYFQTLMFPHFIYPLNSISLMCSIYMTLIVALERYMAGIYRYQPASTRLLQSLILVYNPLDYNRRQQDSTAQRYHIINFVCPLIILALLFNLTKFFESEVVYYKVGNHTKVDLDITPLRSGIFILTQNLVSSDSFFRLSVLFDNL